MRTTRLIAALLVATGPCLVAHAQQQAEQPYIYATYYYCDVTRQEQVDQLVMRDRGVLDDVLRDGSITGWGWLAHNTGGRWRRLQYFSATSVEALLDAGDKIQAALNANRRQQFGAICNAHDDYIWHGIASSSPAAARGKVSLSTYFNCDQSKAARADEIVRTVIAPVYNAHVGDGMLRSWGWNEHLVGGEFRRLATVTADDWGTLMRTRETLIAALANDPLANELFEICSSHADYMWDIQMENIAQQ